jgi:hypothetical protein
VLPALCGGGKQTGVILFTEKFETAVLYKSLAYQLRDIMTLGEVRAKNTIVGDHFQVRERAALPYDPPSRRHPGVPSSAPRPAEV